MRNRMSKWLGKTARQLAKSAKSLWPWYIGVGLPLLAGAYYLVELVESLRKEGQ